MKGAVLVRVVLIVAALTIAAAIAGPRVLEAYIRANEAAAVADTRTVISAEQAYASANKGYFDEIQKLCREGAECVGIGIPEYPADEPSFLDEEIARRSPYTKQGYRREWIENGRPTTVPVGSSPTSALDYCYVSTPLSVGISGKRSFSGGGRGVISEDASGMPISCPVPWDGYILE